MNGRNIPHPKRNDNPNARLAFWIANPLLTFEDFPSSDEQEEEYVQEAEAWEAFLRNAGVERL